jgi:hypothetical protein
VWHRRCFRKIIQNLCRYFFHHTFKAYYHILVEKDKSNSTAKPEMFLHLFQKKMEKINHPRATTSTLEHQVSNSIKNQKTSQQLASWPNTVQGPHHRSQKTKPSFHFKTLPPSLPVRHSFTSSSCTTTSATGTGGDQIGRPAGEGTSKISIRPAEGVASCAILSFLFPSHGRAIPRARALAPPPILYYFPAHGRAPALLRSARCH